MALARYNLTILDSAGNVVNGASVEVRLEATSALAALKSDRAGATPITNPFTATDGADAGFYVVGGAYKVRVYTGPSGAPTFERIWRYVPIGTAAEYDYSVVPSIPPQGKLTLASGVPTMRSTIAGATAVLYTNAAGATVPLTADSGVTFANAAFSETTQNLSDTTKSPAAAVPNAIYDIVGWDDAGTIRFTRSDYWKKSATVTMTIASPCVVTDTGNDYDDGSPYVLTTTGALATGLTAGTTVFVKHTTPGVIANTFNLSATVGGAAINTSGSQSGVHTGTGLDKTGAVARGVGGNCEIDFSKLYPLNKNAITNGPGALAGTYLGTVMTNSAGTVDHILCSRASDFGAGSFGVWNAWNKELVNIGICAKSSATFYSTTNTTMNAANNSATARVTFVRGLNVDLVELNASLSCSPGSASVRMVSGFGLNSTASFSVDCLADLETTGLDSPLHPTYAGLPGLGRHYLSLNERQSLATSSAWRTEDLFITNQPFGFTGFMWL